MTTTTDFSLKLQAIADAMVTAWGGMDVVALSYDPVAAEVENKTVAVGSCIVRRTDLEEAEQQQGSTTWVAEWVVTVYVKMDVPSEDWATMRGIVGLLAATLDAHYKLGGEVQEVKMVESIIEPGPEDATRRLLQATCTVRTLFLMPDVYV